MLAVSPIHAASFTVTSLDDSPDANVGDGQCASVLAGSPCTLRAAIQEANASVGADQIVLPAGNLTLSIAGLGEDLSASGDLDISESVSILGAGESLTHIDGADLDRVLDLRGSGLPGELLVAMTDLTVENGQVLTLGEGEGGGCVRISDNARLTFQRVTVDSCSSRNNGVGILNQGALVGDEVTISNNISIDGVQGFSHGGGISIEGPGTLIDLSRCSIHGNVASNGGGINALSSFGQDDLRATINLDRCSITHNEVLQLGGGINAVANTDVAVTNTTIAENIAGMGGGIFNDGFAFFFLSHVTVAGNDAHSSGGIGEVHFNDQFIQLANSVVAGNTASFGSPDCNLRLHSVGGSLIGDTDGCMPTLTATDLADVDALLGALAPATNGDRTQIMRPLPGSPLIDSALAGLCEGVDQRGVTRPADGDGDGLAQCDRGAVEVLLDPLFVDGFEAI